MPANASSKRKRAASATSGASKAIAGPKVVIRRPAPADIVALATRHFREGRYKNIEQLAGELGVSRATAYKWAGNGEQMLSRILTINADAMFTRADEETDAQGAERVCRILMSISRQTMALKPFRRLLEQSPEKTLRLVASKSGPVQKLAIARMEAVLQQEVERGHLRLPLDSHTMAYILIRLCESFLYADTIAGETVDLSKQEAAIKALLGQSFVVTNAKAVKASSRRSASQGPRLRIAKE